MADETAVVDVDQGVVDHSEWVRKWKEGETGWHCDEISSYLSKNSETILGQTKKRIFIPLCGKTQELIWFSSRGHTVVGVEIAEDAVKEIFEENNLEYDVENYQDIGNLYKSKDRRLLIWAANVFSISAQQYGKFDIIWDSKSLVAINLNDHTRYLELMKNITNQNSVYYLETLVYDEAIFPGPPHSINNKTVHDLFGDVCQVDLEEETDLKRATDGSENAINHDKPVPIPPPVEKSSFIILRWYKMTFK